MSKQQSESINTPPAPLSALLPLSPGPVLVTAARAPHAWERTQAEIYDQVYCAVREALHNGVFVPCRMEQRLYLLMRPDQIRQLSSPTDIQIRAESGWVYVLPDTVDEWARTFDLTGPTEYLSILCDALHDGYPVPKDIVKAYHQLEKYLAGKALIKPQLTRTVNEDGAALRFDGLERPEVGDRLGYPVTHGSSSSIVDVSMLIREVLCFKPALRMWQVFVAENDCQFIIQRVLNSVTALKTWQVYRRSNGHA